MPERTVQILVEGLVQGVGFRAWLAQEAKARSLVGWVRNRRTGAVEAMLSGTATNVSAMITACRRGPSASRVDALFIVSDVSDDSLGTFSTFEVHATA